MKISIRFLKFYCLLIVSLLLISCGSAPTIKESKVLSANVEKIHSLQFIYRNIEMKTTSSTSYGVGATPAETGFSGFGALLARQAGAAFVQRGVVVVDAKVLDGKEPIRIDPPSKNSADITPPILVMLPISGKVSANGRATTASYVFAALLIESNTQRPIWRATIDTSSWSGQDVVLKHATKTLYDESYASQLLNAVANQMKLDGVI